MAKQISEERKREILELLGDPAQRHREMAEFSAAAQAFEANLLEYREKYPEQWVGVTGDEIFASPDIEIVFNRLASRGIPRERAFVKFVSSSQHFVIL